MWTLRDFVKPFVTAFVISFACVGWAHLMQLSAIITQTRGELFVDCAVAATIGTLIYVRLPPHWQLDRTETVVSDDEED